MDYSLKLNTVRARESRRAAHFNEAWLRALMWLVALTSLFFAGVLLGQNSNPLGYILFIPLTLWLMVWSYWSLNLKHIKYPAVPKSISDLLDQDLLENLHGDGSKISLKVLCDALDKSFGGRFLSTRFALSNKAILSMLEASGKGEFGTGGLSLETVLARAHQIAAASNSTGVKSIYISAALVDEVEKDLLARVLASVGLSDEDLAHAIEWFDHFESLVAKSKVKKKTGGLGRDLSFGYTPLLSSFGSNLSDSIGRSGNIYRTLEGNQEAIDQMMHVLSSASRLNAGIVGRVGMGKSNLVWNLAERLLYPDPSVPANLKYKQVYKLEASTLIANSQQQGQLEDTLIRIFNEAFKAKNIILFLDDAEMFLENGAGKVDLSGVLSQVLEAGGSQIIMAFSDQGWLKLSYANPALAGMINRVNLVEISSEEAIHVAQDQVLILEGRLKVRYLYQTLKAAVELSERFIQDEAKPGKVIKLLEYAAAYAKDGWVTKESVQDAIEKNYGVRIKTAIGGEDSGSQNEAEALLNLESLIHERMINQSRAVKVVSDALRRARAGVRNVKKPVGTFLFIGPTGVGKTELAKSLAATYFGGEDNLVRLDMNEFSQPSDVGRLLAQASENGNSLTAQISKQPFSVVLLDELEKAHPNVLNVLLQMLDEGILRDTSNKEVSFRESIIIATSNAGAQYINQFMQEHGTEAEAMKNLESGLLNELISQGIFKPEFVNRFDEVATFRSLNESELKQVVGLIIKGVNKTLAAQKLQVSIDGAGAEVLVKNGNDPMLGARPMRRIVQKTVENIVAERILRGEASPGTVIVLSAQDIEAHLG
ncbi:MAG: ATP-dependent Clp protease ATP-binding subunit ClpC [Patescibacteria group bacterium]|nr:ATP-dependent Clp protease ATP-binding subunit ClpC [Patescibacteria group bacterium]